MSTLSLTSEDLFIAVQAHCCSFTTPSLYKNKMERDYDALGGNVSTEPVLSFSLWHTIVTLTLISCGPFNNTHIHSVLLEGPSCSLCWKSCLFSLFIQTDEWTTEIHNSIMLPASPIGICPGLSPGLFDLNGFLFLFSFVCIIS